MKIAVLVSGSGTNLQALIDAVQDNTLVGVEIALVVADRNCFGLERALDATIPSWYVERDAGLSAEVDQLCKQHDIDLIVLAGFLSILSADFCHQWERKIINLHPSLLPKYGGKGMYGKKVHQAVIAHHEKESGATVHYVTSGIDEGEIIAQESFKIKSGENVDWLAWKISQIEKPLLIRAIQKIAATQ